jgi:hypothetical protein
MYFLVYSVYMEQEKKSSKKQYEIKKAEREAERKKTSVKDKRSNAISSFAKGVGIIGGLVVVIVLFVFWLQGTTPQTEDMSRVVPILESPHIVEGSLYPEYNSNPPTSGPHYAIAAAPGFRGDEEIADEHLVHSLEHGTVWISYQSDVPESFIEILEGIAKGDNKVVVTKRDTNDTEIAVASWGRLDAFDLSVDSELDSARVRDFIARYKNKGPERVDDTHGGI